MIDKVTISQPTHLQTAGTINRINFCLCPDKYSARMMRRKLTVNQPLCGRTAGTWTELLDLVCKFYCISSTDASWDLGVEAALARVPKIVNAFWEKSLAVDPQTTAAIIAQTLQALLTALGPENALTIGLAEDISPRGKRQFADLIKLHQEMSCALPSDLDVINRLLTTPSHHATKVIKVQQVDPELPLNPWQAALLARLEQDCARCNTPDLMQIADPAITTPARDIADSALAHLQQCLFTEPDDRMDDRSGLQWLNVRDYLEEIEIAAQMIQTLITTGGVAAGDIGLVLPATPNYTQNVKSVFTQAGIVLANLSVVAGVRDLGHELVYLFLQVRHPQPAPPMAKAALIASPLLPWRDHCAELAQGVINGRSLASLQEQTTDEEYKALCLLLGKPVTTSQHLKKLLWGLISIVNQGDNLVTHRCAVQTTIKDLLTHLPDNQDIPWDELLRLSCPQPQEQSINDNAMLEGVAVFHPQHEPWRHVRHLFLLGFSEGQYPEEASTFAIIPENDRLILAKQGVILPTNASMLQEWRRRFRHQLGSASESITFFVPGCDGFGQPLAPSTSLSYIARLFAGIDSPEELLLNIDKPADLHKICGLLLATVIQPSPPQPRACQDLQLGENLLIKQITGAGDIAPESPSRLEKLLVSPLAWLLNRFGIESRLWAPLELDAMTRGTIAHAVMQRLFQHQVTPPAKLDLPEQIIAHLNDVLAGDYPFMLTPEWRAERRQLLRMLTDAASAWLDFLVQNKLEILAEEVFLNGTFADHPIHGKADAVLANAEAGIFVVDYKTSSSNQRKTSMTKGFDLQTTLYCLMLETGTLNEHTSARLKHQCARINTTFALYYTLQDQIVLGGPTTQKLTGMQTVDNDISVNAIERIEQRMQALRAGIIELNTEQDANWFEREAGIKPYALDDSPLIRLFMQPGEES